MTAPDLAVLEPLKLKDINPDTIRQVADGVWFAMRDRKRDGRAGEFEIGLGFDIRNGVWWTDDGSRVVSLATGTGLHAYGGVDFETYVFMPTDVDIDVCCHESMEAAEACALTFISEGHWCGDSEYVS